MLQTALPPEPILSEPIGSVKLAGRKGWRRYLAFVGPGFLVSVGYMDPGNWSTDLSGGSRYGYALLWVVLASSLMAMLLQTLCARLGVATGKDLAEACRDYYPRPVSIILWILCEIAIVACDIAEVIGSAVALNLLLGLPLVAGVLVTGLDVLILLGLSHFGFRKLEAFVIALVATIFVCFALNIWMAQPNWAGVGRGLIIPQLPPGEGLLIAVGILGATVMPHNLYLHSALVKTRDFEPTTSGRREAVRYSTWDALLALGGAFFVNAAILVLAAALFFGHGKPVEELQEAHSLLRPALGGAAATMFAVALLCSGQSSTITGTMAGQVVMEGFLRLRVKPWVRRMATRLLAIVPAVIFVVAQGGRNTIEILNWTQVILSMQLPFAIFPLVFFTSDRRKMGEFASPLWLKIVAVTVGVGITGLNLTLLYQQYGIAVPAAVGLVVAGGGFWVAKLSRQPE